MLFTPGPSVFEQSELDDEFGYLPDHDESGPRYWNIIAISGAAGAIVAILVTWVPLIWWVLR